MESPCANAQTSLYTIELFRSSFRRNASKSFQGLARTIGRAVTTMAAAAAGQIILDQEQSQVDDDVILKHEYRMQSISDKCQRTILSGLIAAASVTERSSWADQRNKRLKRPDADEDTTVQHKQE